VLPQRSAFRAPKKRHPLPEVEAATAVYERDRRDENIAAIAVASAEWNFTPAGVAAGRELLARMPYNSATVDWSEYNFDHIYRAAWWLKSIPVLVMAGAEDRIVWQGGWDQRCFHTPNAIFRKISNAKHYPWIENPSEVRSAFHDLVDRIP
jgi:pimeloyl-ACP methyl ester carboxylesterase